MSSSHKPLTEKDILIAQLIDSNLSVRPLINSQLIEALKDYKCNINTANIIFNKYLLYMEDIAKQPNITQTAANKEFEKVFVLVKPAGMNGSPGAKALLAEINLLSNPNRADKDAQLQILIDYLKAIKNPGIMEKILFIQGLNKKPELRHAVSEKLIHDYKNREPSLTSFITTYADSLLLKWLKTPTSFLGMSRLRGGPGSYKRLKEAAEAEGKADIHAPLLANYRK